MIRGSEAVVLMAALDLRRRPDHRSELRSQLLLGETVRILRKTRDGVWARVRNRVDGYEGWVRSWGVRGLSPQEASAWRGLARSRVSAHLAHVRARPGRGPVVTPVFWNSPLAVRGRSGRFRRVRLPSGGQGWVDARSVRARGSRAGGLRQLVDGLMGTPYLWGGRTPLGFDCSGFVQQLLAARGVAMPRDAHEQFLMCRPLSDRGPKRIGDLVFFGRPGRRISHVGVLLGKELYAHARGVVRLNSLEDGNALYDNALRSQVRGFGRPRSRP